MGIRALVILLAFLPAPLQAQCDLVDSSSPARLLENGRCQSAAGHPDSSIMSLRRFLAAGGDSGVGLYHLARQLFRMDSSRAAVRLYLAGTEHVASGPAAALYRQDVRWIASPSELAAFDALHPSARGPWLRTFWAGRDVAGGFAPGGRLIEHYRRYEHALRTYAVSRSSPAQAGQVVTEGANARLPAPGDPESGRNDAGKAIPQQAEGREPAWDGAWDAAVGPAGVFREYKPAQSLVDDRGVIYIRQGPPDDIAFFVGGAGTPANASWVYHRPGSDMVFHFLEAHFDGSSGATALVTALPRSMFASRCGVDARLCMLSTQRGPLAPEVLVRERDRARASIQKGTTTDWYARTFGHALNAVVQLYGMPGLAGEEMGELLAVVAIPAGKLAPPIIDTVTGKRIYEVRVQVIALNGESGVRLDADSTRRFVSSRDLGADAFVSATTELQVPPGEYNVTVVVSQNQDEFGTMRRLDAIDVPARDGALVLGDIVLGRADAGLAWRTDGLEVPLNPLNAYKAGSLAELYYRASGLGVGQEYEVRVSIFRHDAPEKVLLALDFREEARQADQVFQRAVGLEKLRPGEYVLAMSMRSKDGRAVAGRSARLNVVR